MQAGFKHRILALSALLAAAAQGRTLQVGPGKQYAKPCATAGVVQDGDTVLIDPGVYSADVCTWNAHDLVLRATAKYAHLKADGAHAGGKGTWVIRGRNCKVENIEFSGSTVPDENGAGIRLEGPSLTVNNCFFHDNENGILTGGGSGEVLIENSEFTRNGFGDGQSHNMYIGNVAAFTLRNCYTHRAKIGHNIKSRAAKNSILYNTSIGGTDGTESYELDLPNGGQTYVIGNVFQQGPDTDNSILVAYGMEGLSNPIKELYIVNNTLVNDRSGGTFISANSGTTTFKVANNLFVGGGTLISGRAADTAANLATNSPGFVDRAAFDYRLTAASPALDKGVDPATLGTGLAPLMQMSPGGLIPRPARGKLDLGAFELEDAASTGPAKGKPGSDRGKKKRVNSSLLLFPGRDGFSPPVSALGRRQS